MSKNKKKAKHQAKEVIYYVKGMHCASCEVLIEKKLIELRGVRSVEASTSKGEVVIEYVGRPPSLEKLNKVFKEDGYVFSSSLFKAEGKATERDGYFKGAGALLLVVALFLILDKFGIAKLVSVDARSSLPAFLLLGLMAGLTSCAALVGGIVLSMSKQWFELYSTDERLSKRLQPNLLFNGGRLISYAGFGAVLGLVGETLQLSATVSALLVIGVSAIMLVLGLQMLGVKYLQRFQFTMPKFVTRYVADEKNFKGRYMPLVMGALTFFLPCGFTITAQSLALISGSALQGSLIMLFFALGTLPMLLLIGVSSVKLLEKPHLSDAFSKVAGIIVLFFAIYNINNQLVVLNVANLSDVFQMAAISAKGETQNLALPPIVNGKQLIEMEATAFGYNPNAFRVRVGVPVRWEIKDTGTSGCTNAIIAQSLFDGQIALTPGKTSVKEFTPTKVGKFRFSCWMGMVNGVIEVVDEKNPQSSQSGIDETKQSGSGSACCPSCSGQ